VRLRDAFTRAAAEHRLEFIRRRVVEKIELHEFDARQRVEEIAFGNDIPRMQVFGRHFRTRRSGQGDSDEKCGGERTKAKFHADRIQNQWIQ